MTPARPSPRRRRPVVRVVAEDLLQLGAFHVEDEQRAGALTLPGTRQVMADLPGARATVIRALSRLRRDGLIGVHGRTVAVLAPELLAPRADERLRAAIFGRRPDRERVRLAGWDGRSARG
ncbi:helix-turn-helix domain-containing protein [Sphaerisporangium sp. NPDC004334]